MSEVLGLVKFKDGTIKYFVYNGVVNIAGPKLFDTCEKMYKKNNEYIDIEVKHSIDDEEVEIYSDYANGFYWTGRANKEKMIITSCCLIDDIDAIIHQGQPDWAAQFLADINNFCYDEK